MYTGLKQERSNEELVALYRESRNEDYLQDLITQNRGLINILCKSYLASIPKAEMEDLISEAYMPMLRAIEEFDTERGIAFPQSLRLMYSNTLTASITRLPDRNALQDLHLLAMRAYRRSIRRAVQSWIAHLR